MGERGREGSIGVRPAPHTHGTRRENDDRS